MNKIKLIYLNKFSLLIFIFFVAFSCTKDEAITSKSKEKGSTPSNEFPKGNSGTTFLSGSNGGNFITGNSGTSFVNGTSGSHFAGNGSANNTTSDDATCLCGNWILASTTCNTGYHLLLSFFANGTGDALHLDEFLCVQDMHRHFTWTLSNSVLKIHYIDVNTGATDDSETTFSCPSSILHIKWNGGNDKFLTKQ